MTPPPLSPPTAELDQWFLTSNQDGYKAPEQVITRLAGIVKGHPRLPDGSPITTTRLTGKRQGLVLTCNTAYRLGTPAPEYAKLYPNAIEEIMAVLPEV